MLEEKTLSHKSCAVSRYSISRPQPRFRIQIKYFTEKLLLEVVVSHNVLYYQQLSIARYQVSFYANNYFEQLPPCLLVIALVPLKNASALAPFKNEAYMPAIL